MVSSLRERLPKVAKVVRRVRRELVDGAWRGHWRAVRAVATPWVTRELAEARARLAGPHRDVVIDRARLDGWLRAAAPPGIPFEAVVLPGPALASRFPEGPRERRGLHLIGKLRMTHRAVTSPAVLVIALFSDVAADYFVETMAADVAREIDGAYGDGVAIAEAQAGIPIVLKEFAAAAGLGFIGKNALFYSHRFGFHCKLSVVFLNAPVSAYEATPSGETWKLPDCASCNLCVEACPVGAFDDYRVVNAQACDRFIAADYFGPRRDHMCRACITRCPPSNDLLKLHRKAGVPQRAFWDNEAQLSLAADLFMYRPSFWIWVMQRFYYGAPLPGREPRAKKSLKDALTSSVSVTTSERTRDGWRLAARKRKLSSER